MTNKRPGSGQNTAREIEQQVETRTGHPTSAGHDDTGTEAGGAKKEQADEFFGVAPRSNQHARKGQAESPRELNPNQPEKKHKHDR